MIESWMMHFCADAVHEIAIAVQAVARKLGLLDQQNSMAPIQFPLVAAGECRRCLKLHCTLKH